MKKFVFFALSLLLFSCTQDELSIQPDGDIVSSELEQNEVCPNDLDNFVKVFNLSKSRTVAYTVSTITNLKGEPCIYVLNFNKGGWALVSATKKFQPLLAYNEEGEFNENELLPDGLAIWKDNAVNFISNVDNYLSPDSIAMYQREWKSISPQKKKNDTSTQAHKPTSRVDHYIDSPFFCSYFTREDYNRLRGIMADSIAIWRSKGYRVETFDNVKPLELIPGPYGDQGITIDDLLRMCDGMTYILYSENFRFLSCAVYKDITLQQSTGPLIKTKWDQRTLFNQSFPRDDKGRLCVVGCGPLAVGQLMRYFEHPKKYVWSDMPLTYATQTTSKFLLDIANEMHATFGADSTGTTFQNYIDFLGKYYIFETNKKATNSELKTIIDGRISLISAVWDTPETAHTWLSGGYSTQQRMTRNDIYTFTLPDKMTICGNMEQETWYPSNRFVYMIWGNYGKGDGYYGSFGWHFPFSDDSHGSPTSVQVLYNFQIK